MFPRTTPIANNMALATLPKMRPAVAWLERLSVALNAAIALAIATLWWTS